MDNLDDSENNAKISDSAYSNSCSNSQSRRSHSSKSTHSGSNSSGSSGYGGKPSTSGSSNNLENKSKESKKKKKQVKPPEVKEVPQLALAECRPPDPVPLDEPKEEVKDVIEAPMALHTLPESGVENMDISNSDQGSHTNEDGFFCVISLHDGVVMYTTSSLTTSLGFPKEMWIGRSFIDFVHPKDRTTFASQITNGLAVPKIVNGTQEKVFVPNNTGSTMVCRLRKYRGLSSGYAVKEREVGFMPFLLKFSFRHITNEEGKYIYLVLQATPLYSAFKIPNETIVKAVPFLVRHTASGNIEYVDNESVSYLGYLPQDLYNTSALLLYHPDDLPYLKSVYETIVKEGSVPRSKAYRLMTQNGSFIKVETEWSSFINPWSMKLEFVIGKHYILEGPENPDVFQTPEPQTSPKVADDEQATALRDAIVTLMNDVLTKPAEAIKQQMAKRCMDLTKFMESLIEEQPRPDDELRLEIHDQDNTFFERDSVMLGGISPHHDCNDSKSSTATPLSYNQLNYNENLQRYFESHLPYCCRTENDNTAIGENVLSTIEKPELVNSKCLSPLLAHSGASNEMGSSCGSGVLMMGGNSPPLPFGDYQPIRLTEPLLIKHNTEMEKELVKLQRETRNVTSKGDREKASNASRQMKKEHLARCNASFQLSATTAETPKCQGVKRAARDDTNTKPHKENCSSPPPSKRRQNNMPDQLPHSSTITTTVATHRPQNHNMNGFFFGVGLPQQMLFMTPVPALPNMLPMYYAAGAPVPSTSESSNGASNSTSQFRPQPMHCMMYGHPMNGSPFMHSTLNTPVSYPVPQTLMSQSTNYTNQLNLGLASRNYEECIETAPNTSISKDVKPKSTNNNSDDNVDRTDGESSYSSLYSSFFKTESGSAYDSGEKLANKNAVVTSNSHLATQQTKKVARRKMEPPWMEQVCVTSELIYKYQLVTKTKDEVLTADRDRMKSLEQPSLVNEQLGQLYVDLQLEGVAARLTLEEGVTSSSSSGEETSNPKKRSRRKREYSKLVMIYEEDAPLPSPEGTENVTSVST